jgi:hypothetical protein
MLELLVSGLVALAALAAAAFVLFLVRGRTLEHRLAVLDAVADVSQRLAQLEDSVHANATAPLEKKLDRLTERFGAVEGRVAALALAPGEGGAPSPRPDPASDREVVQRTLGGLGYGPIRIVSERSISEGGREFRVETSREEGLLKGSVFVANGAVVETRLSPVFELFP